MARGRKPKPTALHVIDGTYRPDRHARLGEPKPDPIAPPCPRWLSKEAKREWRRVAAELNRLGLLTTVDRTALAAYCQAYARWRQAEETIKAEGLTVTTDKGNVVQHPAVGTANKLLQIIRGYCAEFGLTPAARARMVLPGQEDDDEFATLLDRRTASRARD